MPMRQVTIAFDEFGFTELESLAERQGVTLEELVAHAAMYYLADADNGRMAAKVPQRDVSRAVASQPERS
jgi:hypothetical protein